MKKLQQAFMSCLIVMAPATAAFAATGDSAMSGFRTFFVLVITIAGLFALAWAAKKYGPFSKVKRHLGLDIIGQVPLGSRAHLALVRVGTSLLLLGVTQNQVSLIKDMEHVDFEKVVSRAEEREGGL